MITLTDAIRRDHERIIEQAEEVLERYDGRPVADSRARKAVHGLVVLESRHEAAEARNLWPVVRDALPEYRRLRAHALQEEREARRHLHRLHKWAARSARTSDGFEPAAGVPEGVTVVVQELIAHIGLEQSEILPALDAALERFDSIRIGQMFRAALASAPSRPHPKVPPIPGLLALVSPAAVRYDRVRDLLRRP
jgi:hypothetical protein